tara:strand:+ start:516 stop:668 length:153 start_codon:yes stop_codon:yes gene_type:complete
MTGGFNFLKTNWQSFFAQIRRGNNPFEPPSNGRMFPPLKTRLKRNRRPRK